MITRHIVLGTRGAARSSLWGGTWALLVAAVAVPAATAWAGRRAETRPASARTDLTADVVALLRAAPDLIAFDAAPAQLARIDPRDGDTRIAAAPPPPGSVPDWPRSAPG